MRPRRLPPTQTEPGPRCSFWSIPPGPHNSGPSGSPGPTQGGLCSGHDRNTELEENTHAVYTDNTEKKEENTEGSEYTVNTKKIEDEVTHELENEVVVTHELEDDVTQASEALTNKGETRNETIRNVQKPEHSEVSLMKILKQAHLVPQKPRRSRSSIRKPNKITKTISKSANSGLKPSAAICEPSVAARTDIRGYFNILTDDRYKTNYQRGKVSGGEGESN